MGLLTALVFATPIFGFALLPPQVPALPSSSVPVAQVDASAWGATEQEEDASDEGAPDANAKKAPKANNKRAPKAEHAAGANVEIRASTEKPANQLPQDEYVAQLRTRARYAKIHRTLGIATWGLSVLAAASGTVAYHNQYGYPLTTKLEDTPCVQGNAWFGQKTCYGQPWGHAILGFSAGALYFSTLSLAVLMPDPDNASKGNSKYARTLRLHKLLRWVHLAGMLTQVALGVVIANPGLTGLDRSNDYDTLKLLAGIHLGSGYVTVGALSWAGSLMVF